MALGMRNLARLPTGSLWACVLFRGLGRAAIILSIGVIVGTVIGLRKALPEFEKTVEQLARRSAGTKPLH